MKPATTCFFCSDCNMMLNSEAQCVSHMDGLRHKNQQHALERKALQNGRLHIPCKLKMILPNDLPPLPEGPRPRKPRGRRVQRPEQIADLVSHLTSEEQAARCCKCDDCGCSSSETVSSSCCGGSCCGAGSGCGESGSCTTEVDSCKCCPQTARQKEEKAKKKCHGDGADTCRLCVRRFIHEIHCGNHHRSVSQLNETLVAPGGPSAVAEGVLDTLFCCGEEPNVTASLLGLLCEIKSDEVNRKLQFAMLSNISMHREHTHDEDNDLEQEQLEVLEQNRTRSAHRTKLCAKLALDMYECGCIFVDDTFFISILDIVLGGNVPTSHLYLTIAADILEAMHTQGALIDQAFTDRLTIESVHLSFRERFLQKRLNELAGRLSTARGAEA